MRRYWRDLPLAINLNIADYGTRPIPHLKLNLKPQRNVA